MMSEPIRINTINDAAALSHEIYLSYIAAGFSEEQAFRLMMALMVAGVRNNNAE